MQQSINDNAKLTSDGWRARLSWKRDRVFCGPWLVTVRHADLRGCPVTKDEVTTMHVTLSTVQDRDALNPNCPIVFKLAARTLITSFRFVAIYQLLATPHLILFTRFGDVTCCRRRKWTDRIPLVRTTGWKSGSPKLESEANWFCSVPRVNRCQTLTRGESWRCWGPDIEIAKKPWAVRYNTQTMPRKFRQRTTKTQSLEVATKRRHDAPSFVVTLSNCSVLHKGHLRNGTFIATLLESYKSPLLFLKQKRVDNPWRKALQ